MINGLRKKNTKGFLKAISLVVLIAFCATVAVPSEVLAQGLFSLPVPGTVIPLTPSYVPVMLRGLQVNLDNPFSFDFIIDSGHTGLQADELREESQKLATYFLASLTTPEEDLWVNLSPYESDRIIPEALGHTQMGQDLLAQDYILKQLTASLMIPDSDTGKAFWQRVYKQAYEKYGTTDIPVDTFNKVWIVPERAVIYEDANRAFITESYLKVMLEEDYIAQQEAHSSLLLADSRAEQPKANSQELASQIIRETLIPLIEQEVNHGQNFAQLRQMYHAMILATWYKQTLKESIINQVYSDQKKIEGIGSMDRSAVDTIYAQYLKAYQKGVCDLIKVEYDPHEQRHIARKYFSGGFGTGDSAMIANVMERKPIDFSMVSRAFRSIAIGFLKRVTIRLRRSSEQHQPGGISRRDFLRNLTFGAIGLTSLLHSLPILALEDFIKEIGQIELYPANNDFLYSLSKKQGIAYLEGFVEAVHKNKIAKKDAIDFLNDVFSKEEILWMRGTAVKTLIHLQALTVNDIKKLIDNTPDKELLKSIAFGLGQSKTSEHLTVLIEWSESETDTHIKGYIAEALGQSEEHKAAERLIDWSKSEQSDYVQEFIALGLGMTKKEKAIDRLIDWHRESTGFIRNSTLRGLGYAKTKESIEYLHNLLVSAARSQSRDDLIPIIRSLGLSQVSDTVEPLIAMLEAYGISDERYISAQEALPRPPGADDSHDVFVTRRGAIDIRSAAIEALGRIGTDKAVEYLIKLSKANDTNSRIRSFIAQALSQAGTTEAATRLQEWSSDPMFDWRIQGYVGPELDDIYDGIWKYRSQKATIPELISMSKEKERDPYLKKVKNKHIILSLSQAGEEAIQYLISWRAEEENLKTIEVINEALRQAQTPMGIQHLKEAMFSLDNDHVLRLNTRALFDSIGFQYVEMISNQMANASSFEERTIIGDTLLYLVELIDDQLKLIHDLSVDNIAVDASFQSFLNRLETYPHVLFFTFSFGQELVSNARMLCYESLVRSLNQEKGFFDIFAFSQKSGHEFLIDFLFQAIIADKLDNIVDSSRYSPRSIANAVLDPARIEQNLNQPGRFINVVASLMSHQNKRIQSAFIKTLEDLAKVDSRIAIMAKLILDFSDFKEDNTFQRNSKTLRSIVKDIKIPSLDLSWEGPVQERLLKDDVINIDLLFPAYSRFKGYEWRAADEEWRRPPQRNFEGYSEPNESRVWEKEFDSRTIRISRGTHPDLGKRGNFSFVRRVLPDEMISDQRLKGLIIILSDRFSINNMDDVIKQNPNNAIILAKNENASNQGYMFMYHLLEYLGENEQWGSWDEIQKVMDREMPGHGYILPNNLSLRYAATLASMDKASSSTIVPLDRQNRAMSTSASDQAQTVSSSSILHLSNVKRSNLGGNFQETDQLSVSSVEMVSKLKKRMGGSEKAEKLLTGFTEDLQRGGFNLEDLFKDYDTEFAVFVLSKEMMNFLAKGEIEGGAGANLFGFIFVREDVMKNAKQGDKDALMIIEHERAHTVFHKKHPGELNFDLKILDEIYAHFKSFSQVYGLENIDEYATRVYRAIATVYLDKFISEQGLAAFVLRNRKNYYQKIIRAAIAIILGKLKRNASSLFEYVLSVDNLEKILVLAEYDWLVEIGVEMDQDKYNQYSKHRQEFQKKRNDGFNKKSDNTSKSEGEEASLSISGESLDADRDSTKGGIDFDSRHLDIQRTGDGSIEFNIPAEWQNVDLENIPGFIPVIINIVPITNFNALLGLADEEDKEAMDLLGSHQQESEIEQENDTVLAYAGKERIYE